MKLLIAIVVPLIFFLNWNNEIGIKQRTSNLYIIAAPFFTLAKSTTVNVDFEDIERICLWCGTFPIDESCEKRPISFDQFNKHITLDNLEYLNDWVELVVPREEFKMVHFEAINMLQNIFRTTTTTTTTTTENNKDFVMISC